MTVSASTIDVHHLRIAARDVDVDAALRRLGEATALHLGPRLPRVGGLPERGARAAAIEEVRTAHPLPARRPHHVGIARVELHVDEARLVADELHELPGRAAVGALVEAALLVRSPRVPQRGDVHDVRVARVHDDAPDLLGFGQSHELPAAGAVGRLAHAAARRDGVARVLLAGAEIDDVRVARRDREVAERGDAFVVEHRPEGRAGVGRLPDAARRRRDVEGLRGRGNTLHVGDAAAHVGRPDRPPAEGGEESGVELLGNREPRCQGAGEDDAEQGDDRATHLAVGVSG